jgi:hypothetical protein
LEMFQALRATRQRPRTTGRFRVFHTNRWPGTNSIKLFWLFRFKDIFWYLTLFPANRDQM